MWKTRKLHFSDEVFSLLRKFRKTRNLDPPTPGPGKMGIICSPVCGPEIGIMSLEGVLGGLGRGRDVGRQSNETVPQEECRSLSWWGRKSRQEMRGGISYQKDTVVLSQESASFRGSWSVWLSTMWSVWGCLRPH